MPDPRRPLERSERASILEAAMAMTTNLKLWAVIVVVWLVLALGLMAIYGSGQIEIGTMVFLQVLAVVLAVTVYIFIKKTGELSDTEELENILYGNSTAGPTESEESASRQRRA
jgi:hypothetical protein